MKDGQLTFGFLSGVEKFTPYSVGDIVATYSGKRVVISHVSDNIAGAVFVCINLETGADCVVLEREIAYRSR